MPKLTKEQFAAMLDGRQYGDELTSYDIKLAFENDLVICFGESDDIFNAYGRIKSYACCSDCDFIYFINNLVYNGSDARYPFDDYEYPSLRAFWSEDDDGWRYETDIPHATFKIFSGKELYCIGIVMDYKDIYPNQATPEMQKQANTMHINTNTLIYGHIIQMPQPNESKTAYSFVFKSDNGENYNIAITADKIELLQEHKDCHIGIQCDCKQNTDTWAISDPVFNSMMPCDHSYDFEQTIARLAEQGGGWSEVEDVDAFLAELRGYDALINHGNLIKCGFLPCSYSLSNGHNAYKLPNGDYTIHLDHFTHKEKAQVVVLILKSFDDTFDAIRAFLSITTIPELQAAILDMLAANKIKFEFPVPKIQRAPKLGHIGCIGDIDHESYLIDHMPFNFKISTKKHR